MYKSYIGRTGRAPIKQHLTRTVVVKYNAFFFTGIHQNVFRSAIRGFSLLFEMWLKYCRYGVKCYPINQSSLRLLIKISCMTPVMLHIAMVTKFDSGLITCNRPGLHKTEKIRITEYIIGTICTVHE